MGSMFEIMKKVREDAPLEEELKSEPQSVATAEPMPAAPMPSSFAPDADQDPGGFVPDSQTVEWDAQRVDPAIVAFHDRYSSVCEQFRSIRARLLSMSTTNTHRVIAIASSLPREGKSVTATNLGLVMAEGGEYRTLIADMDFRCGTLTRLLGLRPECGLADVLRGHATFESALMPTPYPNLKLLPAGPDANHGVSELLGSTSTREALARMRQSFDYTFVDTPPVNTVSDVSMLAPYCDGVILVVEMHRTPEPTAQQAVRTLQANNVKVLGCIVTRHEDQRTHYYDRYTYYYRDG
jgi:receptor protein-tyrosine kinase